MAGVVDSTFAAGYGVGAALFNQCFLVQPLPLLGCRPLLGLLSLSTDGPLLALVAVRWPVSALSVANMTGRLGWAAASDTLGRQGTMLTFAALGVPAWSAATELLRLPLPLPPPPPPHY